MRLNKLGFIMFVCMIMGGMFYFIQYQYTLKGVTAGKVIQISKKDDNEFLNVNQLKKLEYDYIPDTKYIDGPSLVSVLAKEGLTTFNEIQLKGINGTYTFKATKPDFDQRLVFFFTEQGTVNLGFEKNYDQFLVKNVNQIYVK